MSARLSRDIARHFNQFIIMKNSVKRYLPGLIAPFLLATVFACRRGEDKSTIVVAKVGAQTITLKAFDDAFTRLMPPDGPTGNEDFSVIKRDLLGQMIVETLILAEAGRMSVEVSDDELDDEVNALKKEYGGTSFNDTIIERYGEVAVWREEIRKKLIIKKTIASVTGAPKSPIEQAARKYYDEHIKEYDVPEQVRARMIVTNSEDDSRRIHKLLTPENFAKTAKEVSVSPEAANGGDLGYFGRGDMPKEFEDAVFGRKPGEITPVVKTDYGYHIFYVEGHRAGKRLKWEDARPKIIEKMRLEEADAKFIKWLAELKGKSHIEVYEALL